MPDETDAPQGTKPKKPTPEAVTELASPPVEPAIDYDEILDAATCGGGQFVSVGNGKVKRRRPD